MGYDITMSFREPYLIWQNTYQLRASWRKMLLCPLEIDQGKQGKDPGKYEFSPSLADVFWTFQGLSSSLWSLITMTEDVSALMSQSIWLPLLSYSYSSDDHQWLLFHWGQWTLIIFYPLLHVALILTPWNVPFLAFMIPAPCASLPISHPCVLGILCRLLITTRVWILMSQGLSFTLLSPHTFWAALRFSTFCLHPLYVLAPCFQILSRSVLCCLI